MTINHRFSDVLAADDSRGGAGSVARREFIAGGGQQIPGDRQVGQRPRAEGPVRKRGQYRYRRGLDPGLIAFHGNDANRHVKNRGVRRWHPRLGGY